MQRISSNATLILKIFLPTFWLVFFGMFTLAVWTSNITSVGPLSANAFRMVLTAFFLAGTGLLYFTSMQLKRVEVDELYLSASNYFKTYRYPWHNVEKMTERDLGVFHLVHIFLKTPGQFGKKISFLLDQSMWDDFLERHPETAIKFLSK